MKLSSRIFIALTLSQLLLTKAALAGYGAPVKKVTGEYNDKCYALLDQATKLEEQGNGAVQRSQQVEGADVQDANVEVKVSAEATAALFEAAGLFDQCVNKAQEGIEMSETGKKKITAKKEDVESDTCQPLLQNPKTASQGKECMEDVKENEEKGHKKMDKVRKKLEGKKKTCEEKRDHSKSVAAATDTLTENGNTNISQNDIDGYGASDSGVNVAVQDNSTEGESTVALNGDRNATAPNNSAPSISNEGRNLSLSPALTAVQGTIRSIFSRSAGDRNAASATAAVRAPAAVAENRLTLVGADGSQELSIWDRQSMLYNGPENGSEEGWRAITLATSAARLAAPVEKSNK